LSKTAAGLANEIGDWAEGTTDYGPFVACTHENLLVALRWLVIQRRLSQAQDTSDEIDGAAIQQQAQRIRTSLDRVKTINRKVTDVRATANDIQTESEALRDEIRASLTAIEDALKVPATPEAQRETVVSAAV
jgi:small-conductance mechanosensitive channel